MNDRAVMEQLASDNMGLAYKIAHDYGNCGLETEDLESAALFGLAKAAMSYDQSRGVWFSVFAARCINNEIRMEIRKTKRHMGQISLDAERYAAEDEKRAVTLMDTLPYEEPGFERVGSSDLIPSLLSGLPARESQSIRLVVCSGMTCVEAARKMGLSVSWVSKCIKSGITKIREREVYK